MPDHTRVVSTCLFHGKRNQFSGRFKIIFNFLLTVHGGVKIIRFDVIFSQDCNFLELIGNNCLQRHFYAFANEKVLFDYLKNSIIRTVGIIT